MTTVAQNIPFKISSSDPVGVIRNNKRITIGQLGQTLDGRIATSSGESKYINGQCGLKHLHELRSAVDAVVVGVGSVNFDNPALTVRLCDGKSPARVIIDPNGRVDTGSLLFADKQSEVYIITCTGIDHPASGLATIIHLPCVSGHIEPLSITQTLNAHGFKKILVEGGNCTLSRFLEAGALDRLHLIVAPVILGEGLSGLGISPIRKLDEALRPDVTLYPLGGDLLFDCSLRGDASDQEG